MTKKIDGFDLNRVLAGLKDFQRDTVEYVYRRMYTDDDCTPRFLVADEVGLGKTLVARGLIAKVIDHLQRNNVPRIDIIYVCSNSSIARQNIRKLNVTGQADFAMPSRLTLLPSRVQDLHRNPVNFVSFTPGTALEIASGAGRSDERVVLFYMLPDKWKKDRDGAINVLRGACKYHTFEYQIREFGYTAKIDADIRRRFHAVLEQDTSGLAKRFHKMAGELQVQDEDNTYEQRRQQRRIIGELRQLLAKTCIDALEPDLIILDEFQRFRNLLITEDNDTHETNELAQALFNYSDEQTRARVLLLSATPYKMYTMGGELGEDHYQDFLKTVEFLHQDAAQTAQLKSRIDGFRKLMLQIGTPQANRERLRTVRDEIQYALSRVMVRTEKLAATPDRNGMLVERAMPSLRLEKEDVLHYATLNELTTFWKQDDPLEYWKSSPYLLNFMEGYKLKKRLHETQYAKVEPAVRAAIEHGFERAMLLPWADFDRYEAVAPSNARLRAMLAELMDSGAWKLLWIPPSLPYYELEGPFAEAQPFTKRLVFSAWMVVPKTLATLISYAVEREMIHTNERYVFNDANTRRRLGKPIPFAVADGNPTNMAALTLLYPCRTFAETCDPLSIARELSSNSPVTLEAILEQTEAKINDLLAELNWPEGDALSADSTWYWAVPVLLDRLKFENILTDDTVDDLALSWQGQTPKGDEDDDEENSRSWRQHVSRLLDVLNNGTELGPRPANLSRILALVAIGSPATAALRALIKHAPGDDERDLWLSAASVGWAFRSIFSQPEKSALIKGLAKQTERTTKEGRETPYWQLVLQYCADGCLQAVLDEYVYILQQELRVAERAVDSQSREIAEELAQAANLQTASLGVDDVSIEKNRIQIQTRKIRSHFALRFGDEKDDTGRIMNRGDHVRKSFNSPFWPFVVITTSVGQEGLDFHHYCHAVVHWNLPSNPVDLEQREGRVHRYKGHVIRKNLAARFRDEIMQDGVLAGDEPVWEALFRRGVECRSPEATDLEPYWIFPGQYSIERYVPALPMSREITRSAQLKHSLMIYRLVFGQPRQEDMVRFLLQRLSEDQREEVLHDLQIQLTPPRLAAMGS